RARARRGRGPLHPELDLPEHVGHVVDEIGLDERRHPRDLVVGERLDAPESPPGQGSAQNLFLWALAAAPSTAYPGPVSGRLPHLVAPALLLLGGCGGSPAASPGPPPVSTVASGDAAFENEDVLQMGQGGPRGSASSWPDAPRRG